MGHAASSSCSAKNLSEDDPEDSLVVETRERLRECGKTTVVPVESVEFGKKVNRLLHWRNKLSMPSYPEIEAIDDISGEIEAHPSREAIQELDAFGASIRSDEIYYDTQDECRSMVASDSEALLHVVSMVKKRFDVVRLTNRFRTPHFNGYRHIIVVLRILEAALELHVHHKQLKLLTESHGYRDGVFFRNVGCAETLQLHRYFKPFFQKGGTVELLSAVIEGDRRVLELAFEDRKGDKAAQLDFLLERLGELDLRARQLLLALDDTQRDGKKQEPPKELAGVLADTGLSKEQANIIGKHAADLPLLEDERVVTMNALESQTESGGGLLFGYVVLSLLAHAVKAEERGDDVVVRPQRDNHKPSTFYYT